jgi:hypothetical protein
MMAGMLASLQHSQTILLTSCVRNYISHRATLCMHFSIARYNVAAALLFLQVMAMMASLSSLRLPEPKVG